MSLARRLLTICLVFTSLGAANAQTPEAQIHRAAKLALNSYGEGYAAALLNQVVPAPLLEGPADAARPFKFAQGEMSLWGSAKAHSLTVTQLRLKHGDLPDLGLQIGVTPVDNLVRDYGQPEKREAHRLVYRGIAEICVDHLVFHIGQGVLQGIEWDWCYD